MEPLTYLAVLLVTSLISALAPNRLRRRPP